MARPVGGVAPFTTNPERDLPDNRAGVRMAREAFQVPGNNERESRALIASMRRHQMQQRPDQNLRPGRFLVLGIRPHPIVHLSVRFLFEKERWLDRAGWIQFRTIAMTGCAGTRLPGRAYLMRSESVSRSASAAVGIRGRCERSAIRAGRGARPCCQPVRNPTRAVDPGPTVRGWGFRIAFIQTIIVRISVCQPNLSLNINNNNELKQKRVLT